MAEIEYLTVDHLSTKDLIRIFSKIVIHDDMWFNGTPCWLWCGNRTTGVGCKGSEGYGHVRYKGLTVKVHRLMFAWLIHSLPKGNRRGELDHLCRVHGCCNPVHLEFTTHRINILRSDNAAAKNAKKTHCKHGHPLSGGNLFYDKGYRQCRTCKRHQSQKRRAQHPDAVLEAARRWRERNQVEIRRKREINRESLNTRARINYHLRQAKLKQPIDEHPVLPVRP